jgi:hypothetical protein
MSTRRAFTAVAAVACIAALPAGADATKASRPAPKLATFEATLSGSQVTTWEYHRPPGDNPCANTVDGNGDQTIKFSSEKFKLEIYAPAKGNPDQFGSGGRPVLIPRPVDLKLRSTADRHGDLSVTENPSHNQCHGDNGGGADPGEEPAGDCGIRHGTIDPHLYFRDRSVDDDTFVPLPGGQRPPERNNLKLEAQTQSWKNPYGSSTSDLDATYTKCPFLLENAYIAEAGGIYTSPAHIAERRLFGKRKSLVVSGSHIGRHRGAYSKGQTIIAWNLRLKRVK